MNAAASAACRGPDVTIAVAAAAGSSRRPPSSARSSMPLGWTGGPPARTQSDGTFGALAPILAELGHESVPIKPGTKAPEGLTGWQAGHPPEYYLPHCAHWGVGVLSRFTPAVDLDIRCRPLVRLLVAVIDDVIGGTPARFGSPPKLILPFSCDAPFRKRLTRWFALPGEDFRAPGYAAHRVELLGDGQQFVVSAVHPGTRRRYRWARGDLLAQHRIDLPTLNETDADRLIAATEAVFVAAGCLPLAKRGGVWVPWSERPEPEPLDVAGLDRNSAGELARRIDPEAKRHGATWRVRCPVHRGASHDSLALKNDGDRLLWHCFAGCSQPDVAHALREYAV